MTILHLRLHCILDDRRSYVLLSKFKSCDPTLKFHCHPLPFNLGVLWCEIATAKNGSKKKTFDREEKCRRARRSKRNLDMYSNDSICVQEFIKNLSNRTCYHWYIIEWLTDTFESILSCNFELHELLKILNRFKFSNKRERRNYFNRNMLGKMLDNDKVIFIKK